MLAVLAFVPLQCVVKAFYELVNYLLESIKPIVDLYKFIGMLGEIRVSCI